MRTRRILRGAWAVLRFLGVALMSGLVCLGYFSAGFAPYSYPHPYQFRSERSRRSAPRGESPRRSDPVLRRTPAAALSGPPPGHPERLVPDLPLVGVERELWAELD